MGLTQSKLAVGDLIFDARLCGPEGGAVVALLHGWPEFSSWWQDSLEALGAAGYRAVAFDRRGYSRGARPLAVAEYCPDRLVDDVLGIPDAVGAQSFHIVAHDWGGMGRGGVDRGVAKPLVDEAAQRLAEPGALSATLNWYRAVDDDLYVPAGEVRAPTLYIWGENDMALGEDAAMITRDFVKAPYQFVPLA